MRLPLIPAAPTEARHVHQLNKNQSHFYRKWTSPSFMFGLQYLKAYHPAASTTFFEARNKMNFSNRAGQVSDVTLFPQLDFNFFFSKGQK